MYVNTVRKWCINFQPQKLTLDMGSGDFEVADAGTAPLRIILYSGCFYSVCHILTK